MADAGDLGSVRIGFEVDLSTLQRDLNRAASIINGIRTKIDGGESKTGIISAARAGETVGMFEAVNSAALVAGVSMAEFSAHSMNAGRSVTTLGSLATGSSVKVGQLSNASGGLSRSLGSVMSNGLGSAAAIGKIALAAGAAIGVFVLLKKAVESVMNLLKDMAGGGAELATLNTAIGAVAKNSGVSSKAVNDFTQELSNVNIFGAQAKQAILNLLNAQLPLNESTIQLAKSAQNIATAYGKDTAETFSLMSRAISTLNPILLEQYGITENLPLIYDRYAAQIGKTASALTEYEKKLAVVNLINQKGAQFAGVYADAQGNVQKKFEQLKSRISTVTGALGTALQPALYAIIAPLERIATEAAKFLTNPQVQAKLTALGNLIAQKVTPRIVGFINSLNAQKLFAFVDGLVQAIRIAGAFGEIIYGVGQVVWAAFKGVSAAIVSVLKPFAVAIKAAQEFWNVITFKHGAGQALDEISNFMDAYNQQIGESFTDAGKTALSGIEKIMAGINGIYISGDFDFEDWWDSLPAAAQKAWDATGGVGADGAGQMSKEVAEALRELQDNLAKENEDFARNQAKAAKDFEEQLAELTAQHRDRIKDLRKDIDKETKTFEKAQAERTRAYQEELDKINKADADRKKDVRTQIAEELAKGMFADQTKLASLQARLEYEDALHKEQVQELDASYQEDTQNALDQHTEQVNNLQEQLDEELAIQQRHASDFNTFRDYQIKDDITKLKEAHAEQLLEDQRSHDERLAELVKSGADQASQAASNGAEVADSFNTALNTGLDAGLPVAMDKGKALGTASVGAAKTGIQEQEPSLGSRIKTTLSNAWAGIVDLWTTIKEWGGQIAQKIGDGIGDAAGAIGGGIKWVFTDGLDKIANFMWDIGSAAIKWIGKAIHSILPWGIKWGFKSGWDALGLPAFAQGGIVQGTSGKDNIMAAVSAGEMILNRAQQSRLFSLLDGKIDSNSSSMGSMVVENINITLPNVKNADDFGRDLQLKLMTLRRA